MALCSLMRIVIIILMMFGVAEAGELGYLESVVLGVVQGVTEFLPVSSTGHLIITNEVMGLSGEAINTYVVMIQGGTILAVVILYWDRVVSMMRGLLGQSEEGRQLLKNIIAAFIPAAVVGLLIGDWIQSQLFSPLMVVVALVIGALLMLRVERKRKRGGMKELELGEMGMKQSFLIGGMQCLAMWPGMSRSMMTIVGGYIVGLSPRQAAEFSFLLGLATLTAASGYSAVKGGSAMLETLSVGPVLVGGLVAFATGALAIRWLVGYLSKHGLGVFAWYRVVLAGVAFFTFYWV